MSAESKVMLDGDFLDQVEHDRIRGILRADRLRIELAFLDDHCVAEKCAVIGAFRGLRSYAGSRVLPP